MNPVLHSKISVKKRGGVIEDYLPLHTFMDSSKLADANNKHRTLTHHHWFIYNVVIPIYGNTIVNSNGLSVNIKDLIEHDHLLPDFKKRFIPSLADYVHEIADDDINISYFNKIYDKIDVSDELKTLMLSPLNITGLVKSLHITHNSWFIGYILPKLGFKIPMIYDDMFPVSHLMSKLNAAKWMSAKLNQYPKGYKK